MRGARRLWLKLTRRRRLQADLAAELAVHQDSLAGKRKTFNNLLWRKTEAVQTLEDKLIKQERGLATRHRVGMAQS